jgi:hypothetical protein
MMAEAEARSTLIQTLLQLSPPLRRLVQTDANSRATTVPRMAEVVGKAERA